MMLMRWSFQKQVVAAAAALLLLLHPVHRRGAVVDLADLVDLLGVEEESLGHGRLARVDVRDDPDVPVSL